MLERGRIIIVVPCCTSLLNMLAMRLCPAQNIKTETRASQLASFQSLSSSLCFSDPSLARALATAHNCLGASSNSLPSCIRNRAQLIMASSSSTPEPLRIACLHGFRQNARQFRRKTGGLRKSVQRDIALIRGEPPKSRDGPRRSLAELYYLDAPFILERIDRDLAVDHTREQQGRMYRTVYSPVRSLASGASPDNNRDADVTERTWMRVEGRNYIGLEKSLEYLQFEFAEKVGQARDVSCKLQQRPQPRTALNVQSGGIQ